MGSCCLELPGVAGDNAAGSYRNRGQAHAFGHRMNTVEPSQLRRAGLKITAPRVKILEILAGATVRHMSAEDVYRRLLELNQDIGLATVYRVLTQFESAGLVTRHHFEGGTAVFELNEGMHHDHIVCVDCGRVEEFSDTGIEDRQQEIATRLGFTITDHSLTLHGHCVRENCPYRAKRD
jgi:Fur family ferric uptake transcriptional regulator